MSGFPTLKPFGRIILAIDPAQPIGALSSGGQQIFVNITSANLTTEPGVEPAVNAELFTGSDWIHADPDGKHLRLDVRCILKTDDGVFVTFLYTGIINVTEGISKIFNGAADAKTVEFGDITALPRFQTGHEKYKSLENLVLVASGRLIITDVGVSVEYKISQVVA